MQKKEIDNLLKQENKYWWHVSRRIILESILLSSRTGLFFNRINQDPGSRKKNKHKFSCSCLPARCRGTRPGDSHWSLPHAVTQGRNDNQLQILDVGCGTGKNLQWLSKFGEVIGVDSSKEAIRLCNQHGLAILGEADHLPSQIHNLDLVTAFDVLEHIKDDSKALQEWNRVLKPNGRLLLTVPAYQWLFGPHDKNLSHYRRYYLGDLILKIENNGFKVIQSSYFFFLTLPVLIVSRFIDKIINRSSGYNGVPPWLNKLLIFLTAWEAKPIIKGWKMLFGSSIIIYAKKQS